MNTIQIMLTKLYLKICGCEFKEIKEYTLPNNHKAELIIFKNDFLYEAQATPFLTIIVNESVFSDYSKAVQDYIITHEFGHMRFPKIVYLIFSALLLTAIFFEIASLVILIFFVFLAIFSINFTPLIISGLIIFLAALLIIWASEIDADFYAIGILGLEKVNSAWKEGKTKKVKKSISKKIIYRLTHPPDRLTFYLYNKIKKHR